MLKQLKYFQSVVRLGSFSAAAEENFISQSAISQQVQSLERELSFALLVRKNRSFSLTPAGEYFYRKSLLLTANCNRMPALTAEQGEKLATTPTEELLSLDFLQPENIRDTLHAYQMAKRCNEKRVTTQAVEWGKRGARLNDIAPGIIVTPLAHDEFNGPRGGFYKNMFAKCPAGRPGTADEVANVAELLMSDKGAFITGSTFLIDGGATASYFYGPLRPEKA